MIRLILSEVFYFSKQRFFIVVIIGFSRDKFILSDPAESKGYRQVKIKDFLKQWYELEDKTVHQGIIIGNY